jgi:hypothetical protein
MRRCWLGYCVASLFVAGCKRFNVVNADDAMPAGQEFWQLLRTNDVANALEMFAPSVWRADPNLHACYAYDDEVKRQTLGSYERLIICGDSGVAVSNMHVYAHEMKRQDTQQVVRVGIIGQRRVFSGVS